ncbi:MAG: SAM-dependent chlorinase/fluorinase [Deltaproteobacteria bacterium]|nr:SAM-dependent chlorinase/fluorinase [Deltaproteobacteria bacterium]
MNASRIITLTTDFGTTDAYAGSMKGAVLSVCPAATIVDITHQIPPQNIRAAQFMLQSAYRSFPPGTVHVAVVDPGVGSARPSIIIETAQYLFVGPDNGIFSFVFSEAAHCEVFEITNKAYMSARTSATFHGRDIFAPVAAHLTAGVAAAEIGTRTESRANLPLPKTRILDAQTIQGEIIHIDHYGNLVTNITQSDIRATFCNSPFSVSVNKTTIEKQVGHYDEAPAETLFCLYGSLSFLEISLKNDAATRLLPSQIGTPVLLTKKMD